MLLVPEMSKFVDIETWTVYSNVSQPFFYIGTHKIFYVSCEEPLSLKMFTAHRKLLAGSTVQLLVNYCQ